MYSVLISDAKFPSVDSILANRKIFGSMDAWARANCKSYVGNVLTDISDVSLNADELCEFTFESERDAAWFKLKFSEYA